MGRNRIDIIIPTYKPNEELAELIHRLQKQTITPNKIILMNTEESLIQPFLEKSRILEQYGNIELHHISLREFDHGKTRHEGVQYSQAPFFLCMTQDALPADEKMVEELMDMLVKEKVAAAYARQLPRKGSSILEEYTRGFNYPEESRVKSQTDIKELGIKAYFCSNVCAAYNRQTYDLLGGFLRKTIFNEDMIYAAKAIQQGYQIVYQARARVIHSHSYTGWQQFTRNFDLGVSQADHPEIFDHVPSEKEGKKLIKGMAGFLWRERKIWWMFPFIYESGCKLIGYRLGKNYKKLPKGLIRVCSMNQNYWDF